MKDYGRKRSAPVGKVLAAIVGVLGIFWLAASNPTSASDPEPIRLVVVPAPAPPVSAYDTLASGETLAEMLADQGLDGPSIYQLTEVVRQSGHKVIGEPRTTGDGYYESVIEDIEGNLIELTV